MPKPTDKVNQVNKPIRLKETGKGNLVQVRCMRGIKFNGHRKKRGEGGREDRGRKEKTK